MSHIEQRDFFCILSAGFSLFLDFTRGKSVSKGSMGREAPILSLGARTIKRSNFQDDIPRPWQLRG